MRSGPLLLVAALGASLVHAPAQAQNYPTRPVRVLVGFAAGGGVDLAARIVAQGLSEVWGTHSAIVENRPGAAGGIATELTAAAPPDGHTTMLCQIGSHAITPARAKKLPYDHIRDFAFVSMVGITPNILVTHPNMALRSLRDVIAYAKKHPGKLSYGSSGVGASPNLSVELLKLTAGIDIVHVAYRGAAVVMTEVMAGQMELGVGNLPGAYTYIQGGKLRGLAVTSATRSPQLPDVPTVAEQGVKGYDVSSWYGICTQAGVPKPIFDKLRADLLKALDNPAVRKRLVEQGIEARTSTPEEFVTLVRNETEKWRRVVREAKIPDQ